LTVCIDLKSPHCFMALAPTLDLAAELEIAIDWQPVMVAASKLPPSAGPGDSRGARHRHMRARYEDSVLARYAQARGLDLRNPRRDVDTSLAAMALSYVKIHASSDGVAKFLTDLFTRFWAEDLDAEDVAAIMSLMDTVGADPAGFEAYASGEGRAALEALQAGLRAAGIFAAPTYVVADEPFVGRQHLPMIRWLLTDQAGPAPV